MKEHNLTTKMRSYQWDELTEEQRKVLTIAKEQTKRSYCPYSRVHVGAAAKLANGVIIRGCNQENAAYPSGLCAERTALFAASAQRPEMRDYAALAIAGRNAAGELCEASPCGACRQVMLEYEQQQGHPLRVLCLQHGGSVREVNSVADLMPFSFSM